MTHARTLFVITTCCLALAGCGDDSPEAESPLDEALGYLPENAPLAVAISTDLEGDQFESAGRIAEKFPFGEQLIDSLKQEIEGDGVDFEEDVEPLLGNEAVIGVAEPESLLADEVEGFVAALETKDGDKLEELAKTDTEEIGEEGDAKLYKGDEDDTFIAVNDDVLVLSDSEDRLKDALEQREGDDRLREEDFDQALEGLPEGAVARLYGNVAALLEADESTATARKVPFVDGLETLGATGSIRDDRITIDFALNTADDVEEDDLPIAAGEEAPPVIGRAGEIGIGVRDPAQIVKFAEAVGQAVAPEGFAEYQTAKRQISQGLGVDLDRDVVAQFKGDVSVAIDLDGNFGARAELEDPRKFESTLRRLVRVIPSFAEGAGFGEVGVARPRGDEDFYAVATPEGEGIVYGVVDDVFVLANDARRAAALASEQPATVQGATGAVVVRANAEQLADQLLSRLGGLEGFGAQLFTGPLGSIVGFLSAGDDGLRGRFTLGIE